MFRFSWWPVILCGVLVGLLIALLFNRLNLRHAAPVTVIWGDDFKPKNPFIMSQKFILIVTPAGRKFEIGLRTDGVVVWREILAK